MSDVAASIINNNTAIRKEIKGKRPTAQFTFKMNQGEKEDVTKKVHRKIINKLFQKNAVLLENEIRQAVRNVLLGLVGLGSPNIKAMGRSLGAARSSMPLDNEQFIKYIKTPMGAGEIGLPDPVESIRNLKIALMSAIVIDVVVRSNGPQVKFRFDQQKLLKLTPHPGQLNGKGFDTFYSWLSLITGPSFIKSIAGYSLVRVSDIKSELTLLNNKLKGRRGRGESRSVKALNGLLRISRTKNNAGDQAALMLSNKAKNGKKSPAEFAGGYRDDYSTSSRFDGFWDKYWINLKNDLNLWVRRVIFAAVRGLLRK
jgi:hypothetical protein